MDDTTTKGAAASSATDDPIVFLHGDRAGAITPGRRRRSEILKAPELAVWPGQSVALVAPSGTGQVDTPAHRGPARASRRRRGLHRRRPRPRHLSDAERTRIRRTEIGFVYQFHHLLPEFSAVENVMLPQMIRGLRAARRRASAPTSC